MYIVYKTTNIINNKFYIGVHKINILEFDNDYLGSGLILKNAIQKYGKECFIRETLFEFKDKQSAYSKEAELVDLTDPLIMNIRKGGDGGFEWVTDEMRKNGGIKTNSILSEQQKMIRKQNLNLGRDTSPLRNPGWHHSEETCLKISNAHIGKKKSEETKQRMKEAAIKRYSEKIQCKICLKYFAKPNIERHERKCAAKQGM